MRWIAFGGGVVLVAVAYTSAVATFVVPRDTPARVAAVVARVVMSLFALAARPLRSYEAKDLLLAFQAPWFLITLLATWLGLIVCGFGLILWSTTPLGLAEAVREAGSSAVTLGILATRQAGAETVDVLAAASGFIVIALLIGYLPALYSAYNRRERLVTLLDSRAGAPAWGPELLLRHQRIGILDGLPRLFERWEEWCADVAETHSTYPVLLYFRSPHPLRSWLTGLVAVLDSAALYMALCPQRAPSEARLCLRMGFTSLRTLADTLSISYDPDPRPDAPIRLTYEEYAHGVRHLVDLGFPNERTAEEAWSDFRGWRVNYEEVALRLPDEIVATPGQWFGGRRSLRDVVIPTKRPVDRTPEQPEGTEFTRPPSQ